MINKKMVNWLVFSVLYFLTQAIYPCDFRFESSQKQVKIGAKTTVSIYVELVHGRCPVEINQTQVVSEGVRIDRKGQWQEVEDGIFRLDLTLTVTGKNARIGVTRDCRKKGYQQAMIDLPVQ